MDRTSLLISIIVRFKNEATFLPAVLAAAAAQRVPGASVRVVGVDGGSSDGSRAIADRLCDRVLAIDGYMPGAAINLAMHEEPCDFACVLSAHTVPASDGWLQALLAEAQKPDTLGVYGAQLYPVDSRFLDKRDLDIFSTRCPRIEVRDSDFWNANSMFARASWELAPFDERTFELEDHYWTKCQLTGGNVVRFVPDALVYHYTHIARNDRVLPASNTVSPARRIGAALSTLNDHGAEWPDTMMAALTVKSLADEMDSRVAIPALTRHLAEHRDFDVRWRMAGTLGKLPDARGVDALITALADPSFYVRDEAAWALAGLGTVAAPRLLARLDAVPPREWPLAALALGRSGHPDGERVAVALIEQGLADTQGAQQLSYAYAAGEIDGVRDVARLGPSINWLLEASEAAGRAVSAWVAGSLSSTLGDQVDWRRVQALAAYDPDPLVRVEAVAALGKALAGWIDPAGASSLGAAAHDPDPRVRYVAVQSARLLAEAGKTVVSLAEVLDDADFGLRFEADLFRSALSSSRSAR